MSKRNISHKVTLLNCLGSDYKKKYQNYVVHFENSAFKVIVKKKGSTSQILFTYLSVLLFSLR